jgi:hypothetical protein
MFGEPRERAAGRSGIPLDGDLPNSISGSDEQPFAARPAKERREERNLTSPVDRREHGLRLHADVLEATAARGGLAHEHNGPKAERLRLRSARASGEDRQQRCEQSAPPDHCA